MDNNKQFESSQPELEPELTPAPESTPTPTPTPLPPASEPEPASIPLTPEETPKKRRSLGKSIALVIVILLAIAGVGYSVYAYMQNTSQQSALSDKDAQITALNKQISTLKAEATSDTTTTDTSTTSGNVIVIRELGISITVPDSIKDLTYSYSPTVNKDALVQFSTKTLTDKYVATGECSSSGTAPPLGALERMSGQAPATLMSSMLVKQFSGYYITYSSPQAVCAQSQTTVPAELQIFKDSLSTVKAL